MLGSEYPRLPLMRELSAKLTEGETIDRPINIFAYTAEIAVNNMYLIISVFFP